MKQAAAPSALSVRGLTVERRQGRARRLVLEDVSLSAQPGEITAVLGAAGAGKTSLLACIAGLIKPARGAVLVGGADVSGTRAGKRGIGFLAPGAVLDGERRLGSVVRAGRGGDAARPTAILELLGLDAALLPGAASHGEGFAALTAARLLPDETVLLLDEAGTGLDWSRQAALLDWLRHEAARGRAVLLATRQAGLALAADHLVLLQRGQVLQAGRPASVFMEPRDAAAALLTGPANILHGTLRQKMPGTLIWVAEGLRFAQSDMAGQAAPTLGSAVALCLRPAHLTPWSPALPNRIAARVLAMTCAGDRTMLRCATALGELEASCETPSSWRPGMEVELGWTSVAASMLAETVPGAGA